MMISGCSLLEISQQSKDIGKAGTIQGRIHIASGSEAPVYVLLFAKRGFSPQLVRNWAVR
jgi:hypothetical protein